MTSADTNRSLFSFLRGPDAFWRVWRSEWRIRRAASRYLKHYERWDDPLNSPDDDASLL